MQETPSEQLSKPVHTSDYLANERTYLAWIRTSLAFISLGFVVAKFNVWLKQIALGLNPQSHPKSTGASLAIGVVMMAMGAVIAALSSRRYRQVNEDIDRGRVRPSEGLITLTTLLVAGLAVVLIGYMLLTAGL